MATDILDVIRTKRDGGRLSDEQVRFFVEGYTAGTIADEQAAALCMAILLRDMEPDELASWTQAMIESGERLDLSSVGRPTVDKHSTGGVGDKVSLPPGAAGGGVRGRGPAALRAGARPHRRHPRQARGHPRVAGHAAHRADASPSCATSGS